MGRISVLGIVLFLWISGSGCDKNDDPAPQPQPVHRDSGEFVALVNDKLWKPNRHTAVYWRKWQQLYILASDDDRQLEMAINLDFSNLLKNYLLESNGGNVAELITSSVSYNSDDNVSDAGGKFVLTKLDTVQMKVSGELQFVSYPGKRDNKITFISTAIKDLPLSINTTDYDGSLASCTAIGVKTTEWVSKDIFADIICSSGSQERLEVQIFSPIMRRTRKLILSIPILKPGVYPVYPDTPPYNSSCLNEYFRSTYLLHDSTNSYHATSGTINIISIDPLQKKMNATFDIIYRNTTRQETIQIKNGILKLESWEK